MSGAGNVLVDVLVVACAVTFVNVPVTTFPPRSVILPTAPDVMLVLLKISESVIVQGEVVLSNVPDGLTPDDPPSSVQRLMSTPPPLFAEAPVPVMVRTAAEPPFDIRMQSLIWKLMS
jgi:hypothetical protein